MIGNTREKLTMKTLLELLETSTWEVLLSSWWLYITLNWDTCKTMNTMMMIKTMKTMKTEKQ